MFFQQFFVFKFLWLISQNSPGVKIRSGRSIALSSTKTCANDLLHKVLAKACLPLSLSISPAVSAILPLNSPFSALCSLLSSTCFLFFFLLSLLLIDFQLVCFVFRCRVWLLALALVSVYSAGFCSCCLPFSCAFPTVNWHTSFAIDVRVCVHVCVCECVCVASELHELKFCTHKICNSLFALPKRIQRFGQRLLLLDFGKSALPKKCQG